MVRIRLATEEDVSLIYRWRQDEEVAYWASGGHGYSAVTYSQLLERIRGQRSDSRSLIFMVEIRENGGWKPIGACSFRDFDAVSRSVIIGFTIGEKSYWGKGYGTRALRVFVDLLFQRYNLHRIQLDTFDENRRAIRCYEKCGFVREGVLRKAFWTIHGYRDKIVMGLLREDWEKSGWTVDGS